MIDPTRVLIVIPCLNEEAHLHGLLDGLVRDNPGVTIVVADGGSADCSRAIVAGAAARNPDIHFLENPRRIQSAGVNLAAMRFGAGRDWLVRIDAHCDYPQGYVAGLLAAAEAQDAASVVVPMVTTGVGCFQRAVAAAQNSVLGTGGSPHRHVGTGRFVDHGHHALVRLDAFLAVGGYDETFSHNEDAEFDQRLTRAGARIWLDPASAITYYPRRSLGPLWRQYRGYGSGRRGTVVRHALRLKLRQAAPLAIAPALLLFALGLLLLPASWWAGILMLPALGWTGLCLASGALLAWRARDRCTLFAGPAAMVMHAAWSWGYWRALLVGPRPGPPPRALLTSG